VTIDPRIHQIALEHLTENQFRAWSLSIAGTSQRSIAYALDISRTTANDRLDAAWRTLRKHGIMVTPDGRPYLAEQEPA
jgi:FixJ family two-component response regulator